MLRAQKFGVAGTSPATAGRRFKANEVRSKLQNEGFSGYLVGLRQSLARPCCLQSSWRHVAGIARKPRLFANQGENVALEVIEDRGCRIARIRNIDLYQLANAAWPM